MFQFWGTIFMAAAVVIFFIAWSRSIKIKDMVTSASAREDWNLFRVLVLVAIIAQLVLVIVALLGWRTTFAYLASIFIAFFSVVYYCSVQFMLRALGEVKGPSDQE
jgi:protein-S-isoprenylcysteine O-methyltransferase Ste14